MQANILVVSLITGLSTSIGAILVIFLPNISARALAFILGFAAGIMIAISAFNLIPSALNCGSLLAVIVGFMLGTFFMLFLDNLIAGHQFKFKQPKNEVNTKFYKIGFLVASGIALHNLPEGLAIGAGYEVSASLGLMLAIAIALHDIPEGIGIAAPLKMGGVSNLKVFIITTVSGLFTVLGTVIGFIVLGISAQFVSGALAFAAGAMIYIASDELIPESHLEHSQMSNIGILIGFLLVFTMENLL